MNTPFPWWRVLLACGLMAAPLALAQTPSAPPTNLPPNATPIQRRGPMVPGSFSILVVGKPPRG